MTGPSRVLLISILSLVPVASALASPPAHYSPYSYKQLQRGRYLTRLGDCAVCHTKLGGGKPFAGGRALESSFGTIYTPNLTPDKTTGIGNWSEKDFYRAMHEGVGPNGQLYYPAFPYSAYTNVRKQDIAAIYAYLMSLKPVRQKKPDNKLSWPFSWRFLMNVWDWLFFEPGTFAPNTHKSPAWNRGAYLVEGLGHCGGCHTPRNFLGAEKRDQALTGGVNEHWSAPNIRMHKVRGIGRWSSEELANFLYTGRTKIKGAAFGPMAEVVHYSLQYTKDKDLHAIGVYLQSMQPKNKQPAHHHTGPASKRGHALYVNHCKTCHRAKGRGVRNVYPALAGSSVVNDRDPTTLIRLILYGASETTTKNARNALAMPAFEHYLDNKDIATLASFVRASWGNQADSIDAGKVADLRKPKYRDTGTLPLTGRAFEPKAGMKRHGQ